MRLSPKRVNIDCCCISFTGLLLHLGKVKALNNMWFSMSQSHTVKKQGTLRWAV